MQTRYDVVTEKIGLFRAVWTFLTTGVWGRWVTRFKSYEPGDEGWETARYQAYYQSIPGVWKVNELPDDSLDS
jgi:hypothetical protein